MVTASHNPKDDNGYKVYWDNGCQIIPPHDIGIAAHIDQEQKVWEGVYASADTIRDSPLCEDGFQEIVDAYMSEIGRRYCFHRAQNRDSTMKVVFTAMHGVGTPFTARAFSEFSLPPFIPVAEQVEPDPEFPTVKFPNPEEKGALVRALCVRVLSSNVCCVHP